MKKTILWGILIVFLAACSTNEPQINEINEPTTEPTTEPTEQLQNWLPVYSLGTFIETEVSTQELKVDINGIVFIDSRLIRKENIGKTYSIQVNKDVKIKITIDQKMIKKQHNDFA